MHSRRTAVLSSPLLRWALARTRRGEANTQTVVMIILAIVGGVLIGVRPGCDTAPCTTAPAVLAGIGAVSAGIPLLAGALTLGLIRDRPSPSDAQARYRLVLQGRF